MNLQSLVSQVVSPKPVKVPAKAKAPVKVAMAKAIKPTKPAKAQKPVKAKKPKVSLTPYTVFFKEARGKWMAVNGKGQSEAARPTVESALAFLKNKYDVVGTVLK